MTIYRINGKRVSRTEFIKNAAKKAGAPMAANTYRGHDPLISEGLGCMKGQVPEMRQAIQERGIRGVVVRDSGQLEFTSRRARRDVCRMRGLVDGDGCYGD